MSTSKDLKNLFDLGKDLLGISEQKPDSPEVMFKCPCGFYNSWDTKQHRPAEVSAEIERHINGCETAQKAFR